MTRIHLRYEGTIQVNLTHKFDHDVSIYSSELQDYCIEKGYIRESLAELEYDEKLGYARELGMIHIYKDIDMQDYRCQEFNDELKYVDKDIDWDEGKQVYLDVRGNLVK